MSIQPIQLYDDGCVFSVQCSVFMAEPILILSSKVFETLFDLINGIPGFYPFNVFQLSIQQIVSLFIKIEAHIAYA